MATPPALRRFALALVPVLAVVLAIGLAELLQSRGALPVVIPAPSAVWADAAKNPAVVTHHLAPTVAKALSGYAIAAGIALFAAAVASMVVVLRAPFSLPYLFTGLRIARANAILGAMLAEWLTGSRGLGYLILESGELREIELLGAANLTSVSASLLVFAITAAAERSVLHWREQ